MCIACKALSQTFSPDRRRFLALSGAGLAAAGLIGPRAAFAAGPATHVTPDEAIERLKTGNAKYVSAPQLCAADLIKQRERVAKGQAPWASIIACADSRVPPELLFGGLGLGELFVARTPGNTAETPTMGTIEYGTAELGVPLIVVVGHARCGAVAAACEVVEKGTTFPGSIGPMVNTIVPAARAVYREPGDFVDNAVRENARRTAAMVARSEIVANAIKAGKVRVLAARYGLDDGRVEFLT